jgi:hypothetical protein
MAVALTRRGRHVEALQQRDAAMPVSWSSWNVEGSGPGAIERKKAGLAVRSVLGCEDGFTVCCVAGMK